MPSLKWLQFQGEVYNALEGTVGAPEVSLSGKGGSWNNTPEETAIFVVFEPNLDLFALLRGLLRSLSAYYNQECIAVTIGDTIFVEGQ